MERVPAHVLEEEVVPFLTEDVTCFTYGFLAASALCRRMRGPETRP